MVETSMQGDDSSSSEVEAPPEEILSDLEAMEERNGLPPAPASGQDGEEEKEEICEHEGESIGTAGMIAGNNSVEEPCKEALMERSPAAETENDQLKPKENIIDPPASTEKQNENVDEREESALDPEPTTTKDESSPTPFVHMGGQRKSLSAAGAPESSSESTRRKWLVIACSICLFLVIVSQVVVIALLATEEDNDGKTNDRDVQGGSVSPIAIPIGTPSPSTTPTEDPTFTPTVERSFQSIANSPGVVRLNSVSSCDDCVESYNVPDGFFLPWTPFIPVSRAIVEANGAVTLESDDYGILGYVEVMSMDLAPDNIGDIYVLWERDEGSTSGQRQDAPRVALIVSWEDVTLYSSFERINAQVEISEGEVEVCFGDGDVAGNAFRTGMWNYTHGGFSPAIGDLFSPDGTAVEFPSDSCYVFADGQNTMGPSQSYASPPPTSNTPWPSSSTLGPTNPSFAGFVYLSSIRDATPLEIVSYGDDTTENVELPFEFRWDGRYPVSEAVVSSNGYILLNGDDCGPSRSCAQINAVFMDLDPSADSASNVWHYQRGPNVFIISWENVPVFGLEEEARVSGQIVLHADGRIDICWGAIANLPSNYNFQSSIFDNLGASSLFATGPFFDSNGYSVPLRYPENTCQTLMDTPDGSTLPSPLYIKQFTFLSAIPESTKLDIVSNFDDDSEVVDVDFPIQWFAGTSTNRLLVTSNGAIRIDGCPTECSECGEIRVAAADLDPSQSGDIWFLDNTSLSSSVDSETAYIISFEDVAHYSYPRNRINAQAHFYYNGTIEMCWGTSVVTGSIQAGLFDPRFNIEVPAWGGPFDLAGFTSAGDWPTELCQAFYLNDSSAPAAPTLYPTFLPPDNPVNVPPCVPTSGVCAATEANLQEMVASASPNDVISLCGGMIGISETITITQINITICCEAYPRCTLSGTNSAPIMAVTGGGGNFTVAGLQFQGGYNVGNGGNLVLDAPGYHAILYCEFLSGRSDNYGGSLYVGNANRVVIANSTFDSAFATAGGGAAAFYNTDVVFIENCRLNGNNGGMDGGGFLFLAETLRSRMSIWIANTYVENNIAAFGGGFVVKAAGSLEIAMIGTSFDRNVAEFNGGAAAIYVDDVISAIFVGNTGESNAGEIQSCNGIYIENNSSLIGQLCHDVSETLMLPLTTAAPTGLVTSFPSPFTLTPQPTVAATPSAVQNRCAPTIGDCIANYDALTDVLREVRRADVIALCAGTIATSRALDIQQDNITICCADPASGCLLVSNGADRIATIVAPNVTLLDLQFFGGRSDLDGGNVAILAPGYHTVINCTFLLGRCGRYGGGLAVGDASSIDIRETVFLENKAGSGGGGLASFNTGEVFTKQTLFERNGAEGIGGGVFFSMSDLDRRLAVVFETTTFDNNQADLGGGFMGTSLGNMPQLVVWNSVFTRNTGSTGGAGLVKNHHLHKELVLRFLNNTGEGIDIAGNCDGTMLLLDSEPDIPRCVELSNDYTYEFFG